MYCAFLLNMEEVKKVFCIIGVRGDGYTVVGTGYFVFCNLPEFTQG